MAMFGNAFRPRGFVGEIEPGSAPAVDPMGIMPGDQPFPPQMQPRGGMFGRIGKRMGGFADRLSNPGKLGQLGAYLMAASGNPLGEAILGVQQQRREDEEAEVQNYYRAAMAKKALEPDAKWETVNGPDGKPMGQRNTVTGEMKAYPGRDTEPSGAREFEYFQGLTPEQQQQYLRLRQPVPFQYTPQGIDAVVEQARRTQPFKGTSGGGSVPKPAATRVVNGVAYYKVNGAWYDNPEGR